MRAGQFTREMEQNTENALQQTGLRRDNSPKTSVATLSNRYNHQSKNRIKCRELWTSTQLPDQHHSRPQRSRPKEDGHLQKKRLQLISFNKLNSNNREKGKVKNWLFGKKNQ